MNNTNRRTIGLELFFSARSSSFAGLHECTLSDVEELASGSVFARLQVAADIHRTLNELMSMSCCPRELIPDEVAALADGSAADCGDGKAIRAFFCWLMDISMRNENDRVARISSLGTVASCFDSVTASFIRTGLALNNQRVFITRESDRLTLSYSEHDWGRVRAHFGGCIFEENCPEGYIPGYAFSTECSCEEDGTFCFRFLIDTRFCENEYCERLMQSEGWHEVSFRCSTVDVDITSCDYTQRLELLGTPRAEIVDRVSSSLLNRISILGSGGISVNEQSMVPTAAFLSGCEGLLTAPKNSRWKSEQLILDALDNRYAAGKLKSVFSESKCPELLATYEKCADARYEDEESAALKHSGLFAAQYELHLADGRGRLLLRELNGQFNNMTHDFDGGTQLLTAEKEISRRICDKMEPVLFSLDFNGSYPHYFRQKERRTEYLSFMLLPDPGRTQKGIKSYYVTLAAALISKKRMAALNKQGISLSQTNALDCQPELSSVSSYGELASADDGCSLRIDFDIHRKGRECRDQSDELARYIKLANHQFRFGRLPLRYTLRRLFCSQLPSPFLRLFFSSLAPCAILSLATLAGYLLLSEPMQLPMLTPLQAFGGSSALCLAATLLLTVFRRLHHAGRLWRLR